MKSLRTDGQTMDNTGAGVLKTKFERKWQRKHALLYASTKPSVLYTDNACFNQNFEQV